MIAQRGEDGAKVRPRSTVELPILQNEKMEAEIANDRDSWS
jgi:hypothetical protein